MGIHRDQIRGSRRRGVERLARVLLTGAFLFLGTPAPLADPAAVLGRQAIGRSPRAVLQPVVLESAQWQPPVFGIVLPRASPSFEVSRPRPAPPPIKPAEAAPLYLAATAAKPVPLLDLPAPLAAVVSAPPFETLSPAAIDQVASLADSTADAIQLNEPSGARALGFNDRIAAMQVAPPPPVRLSRIEQAALLAASPDRLQVRRANQTLGSVAIEIAPTRAVAVRLGDLLDLVASELPSDQFTRLSQSAAADAYVPLETLHEAGIALRYDPVYDEFALGG